MARCAARDCSYLWARRLQEEFGDQSSNESTGRCNVGDTLTFGDEL